MNPLIPHTPERRKRKSSLAAAQMAGNRQEASQLPTRRAVMMISIAFGVLFHMARYLTSRLARPEVHVCNREKMSRVPTGQVFSPNVDGLMEMVDICDLLSLGARRLGENFIPGVDENSRHMKTRQDNFGGCILGWIKADFHN